ncbi:MAG TPA: Nif3-like dinuclear metal center hexameric protein [Gaiella sp.]|nr:Nif3-like dinuclear metal center hexameric protein [Gaiella sp.]
MAGRDEIVAYANELLEIGRFPEFAPQGLQVVGSGEVSLVACGVSCSRELFERAVELGAEMVLVHHGLFWRNEPLVVDTRLRGRLEALFRGDASLVAYHLALDAHPSLGNNAQLAARVGATPVGPFGSVGLGCTIEPVSVDAFAARVGAAVGREPLVLHGGDDEIGRLAVSTGASGPDLIRAAHEGYDAFLTGEAEEPSAATARELGIHLVAAGHEATERFGVQALAEALAERFDVEWSFVAVENPV